MAELPTSDEAFGKPTAEDAFPEPTPFGAGKGFMTAVDRFNSILGGPSTQIKGPYTGSLSDYMFSSTAAGRVLSAFGQGAKDGWGSTPSFREMEIKKELDDSSKEHYDGFTKAFNESFLRPASAAVDFLSKAPLAFFGGVSNAMGRAGEEVGGPVGELLKDASAGALPEAHFEAPAARGPLEGAPKVEPTLGGETPTGVPQGADFAVNKFGETAANPDRFQTTQDYNQQIYKARAEGVIGEGEEGFFGTVEPTPEELQTRQEFAKDAGIPLLEYKPLQVPTIDELAREVNPDAFNEADSLTAMQGHLRGILEDLRNEASEPWEREEFEILDRVGNDTSKLTPEEQNRLNYVTSQVEANKLDTPLMAEIRSQMMEADYRLRDLAQDTRKARETVESLINSDSREGDAYRNWVQARALEVAVRGQELQEALQETYNHAQSLFPKEPVAEQGPKGKAATGAPKGSKRTSKNDNKSPGPSSGPTPARPGKGPSGASEAANPNGVQGEPSGTSPELSPTDTLREIENATGERRSYGLAKSIEQEMGQKFGDLPEYTQMVREDQFNKAAQMIENDPDRALRIALGSEAAPADIYPEALFTGLKKLARQTGDVELGRKLATESSLAKSAKTMGQRLNLLREEDEFDPTSIIQQLQRIREKAVQPKNFDKIVSQAQKFMNQAKNSPVDLKSLLESFQCDY